MNKTTDDILKIIGGSFIFRKIIYQGSDYYDIWAVCKGLKKHTILFSYDRHTGQLFDCENEILIEGRLERGAYGCEGCVRDMIDEHGV